MFEDKPLNHPQGTLDIKSLGAAPQIDLDDTGELVLPNVRIHQGLFEIPYAELIAAIPPSLHPSTPGYASLTFYRADQSDIGAFEFAVFGVGCRSVIRPRFYTISAFASSNEAASYLKRRWGFPCEAAEVHTREQYDAIVSEIKVGGRTVARMDTRSVETLLGMARAIRLPQALSYASAGGKTGLLQADALYDYEHSFRGTLKLHTFDADALSNGKIHATDLIAGTFVKGAMHLKAPKVLLDPVKVGVLEKLRDSAGAPKA